MTTKQQQSLLVYLGYDPGPVDGIPGPQTSAALSSFALDYGSDDLLLAAVSGTAAKIRQPETQGVDYSEAEQYLGTDDYYRIPKGLSVRLSRNFWSHEFDCHGIGCCSVTVIYKPLVAVLQAIRDDMGVPLTVGGSGYRCPVHNAETPGASLTSLHMTGAAADIHYKHPAELKDAALRHVQDGEIGLYTWGCHIGRWNRGYINPFIGGT